MDNKYGLKWVWGQSRGAWGVKILQAVLAIASSVSAIFITNVIQTFVEKAEGVNTESYSRLCIYAVIVVVTYGGLIIASSIVEGVLYNYTANILRKQMVSAIFEKRPAEVEAIHTNDIITRFTTDIDVCAKIAPEILGNFTGQMLLAIMAIVYIFVLSWKMAITICITVPILMFFAGVLSPKVEEKQRFDLTNEEINRRWFQDVMESYLLFFFLFNEIVLCRSTD